MPKQHPNTQVIQVADAFYVEDRLDLAFSIKERNPSLKVAQIKPTTDMTFIKDQNYQLKTMPIPPRYVQKENLIKEFQLLAKRNNNLVCK